MLRRQKLPERLLSALIPGSPFRDRKSDLPQNSAQRSVEGSLEVCTILDVIPHARCYKLGTSSRGVSLGVPISHTSLDPISGPNDINLLSIGTVVLVYFPQAATSGLVVGACARPGLDGNVVLPTSIQQGSDLGITEAAMNHLLRGEQFNGQGMGVENWSSGAPTDQLPGDWGIMSEFGVGLLATKMTAMLRASDNCGIWAFYLDNMLRLHAQNYDQFLSSGERRVYNDESEIHDVEYGVKFPWELMGTNLPRNPFRDTGKGWNKGDREAALESVYEDQTGVWRTIDLRGYLGDMRRRMVVVPDLRFDATPARYSDMAAPALTGLSEIVEGADGAVGIRSAKAISLIKYPLIAVPQQVTLPDDNQYGDWRKNYKASNTFGEGKAAPDATDWKWSSDNDADLQPALWLEHVTWAFNFHRWENLLAHQHDWKLTEESEQADRWPLRRAQIDGKKLLRLRDGFWADMPDYKEVDIDARLKAVRFYESMSALSMQEDGSIVIEDGWGSSIVMSRGHIQLCAAGDVIMRPGRNLISFAPGDTILRSGGSVDVTATTHDVRIKAERNLQLLAGNDSKDSDKMGGILLESRSSGMPMDFTAAGEAVKSGGIVLRCPNSNIAAWAANLYLGTKKLGDQPAGDIMISADEGRRSVFTRCAQAVRDIRDSAIDRFSDLKANYFTATGTTLDTDQLVVRGDIFASADRANIMARGSVMVGGDVLVEGNGAFGGGLSDGAKEAHMLDGNNRAPKNKVKPAIQNVDTLVQQANKRLAAKTAQMEAWFEEDKNLGSSALAKEVTFSLRTDKDYGATGFKLFATRWQQIMEKVGGGEVWKERVVQSTTKNTYPFPGFSAYNTDGAFVATVEHELFDVEAGRAVNRAGDDSPYLNRTNKAPAAPTSLQKYTVTVPVA
jgi:hypothetical protein